MISDFVKYIGDKNREYIIFDIGARDCKQSIEFYETFPNSKIYSFECNPNTLKLCKKNIENYQNRITLIEGAVCDYNGDITFYPINQKKTITTWTDGNPGASSLFKSNGTYSYERYVQDEIKTNCHRLDTIMDKYNIPRVDIIWMDLQGAELLALKGLGEHLKKVSYIYTEVSHKEIYSGQVMFRELNDFLLRNNFAIKSNPTYSGWQEDVLYENQNVNKENVQFDIVIPVGPNDIEVIQKQIQYTKKNIIGYRNIFIISYDPSINIDGCATIDERIFPFSIDTIAKYHGKRTRNGWYLQQLLKLYAGIVIPDILERYLVIDTDTFFLKPTKFIENSKCLYNFGTEYHLPYFKHMLRLSRDFVKMDRNKSGICHHMIFETKYIKDIFSLVENNHGDLFYNVFLKYVANEHYTGSGASEYELYFNYMLKYHSDKIKIRPLKWRNSSELELNLDLDYISWHWYNRT
jgi:FkbM family methyltransferase